MKANENIYRILIIDDTASIHDDFRKVLGAAKSATTASDDALDDLESTLFDNEAADESRHKPIGPEAVFEIDSAMQGLEGIEKLRRSLSENRPYAMAFVDMRMPPGLDGVQTIREMWKLEPTLQVAICTAYSDYSPDQVASELRLDGRMLILRKPFDKAEVRQLASTLCEKWAIGRRAAELERLIASRTAELQHTAMHDSLTGLPNRSLFSDRLNRTLQRSRRDANFKFAVMFIDVDQFKGMNDRFGHDAGDALLLQVADRINGSIRELDTVARVASSDAGDGASIAARLGGDEFAVILEKIGSDADAARVAQRIVEAGKEPFTIKGQLMSCSLSVGLTTNSLPYESAQDMIRDADTAMYQAKRSGRGQFVLFDKRMHESAVARLTFECDLRAAVAQDQIIVHYQPIVDVLANRVTGFEALARWQHPTRGWVPPQDFIAAAEDTGLIIALGQTILEKACRQLAAWHKTNPETRSMTMSVNLSRKQLANSDIVGHISRVLKETGLKPENIKMEITESAVMSDATAAIRVLKSIQSLHVQLQMDDFGTGYSCLSCLQMFPLDGLKIDRAFVKEIAENKGQAKLLQAIITLARSMDMPLVSEGVETPEQLALLKKMGCDYVQGYFFAKPMDAESALKYVSSPTLSRDAA